MITAGVPGAPRPILPSLRAQADVASGLGVRPLLDDAEATAEVFPSRRVRAQIRVVGHAITVAVFPRTAMVLRGARLIRALVDIVGHAVEIAIADAARTGTAVVLFGTRLARALIEFVGHTVTVGVRLRRVGDTADRAERRRAQRGREAGTTARRHDPVLGEAQTATHEKLRGIAQAIPGEG